MRVRFFCANDTNELIFVKGRYDYIYGCPKYYKTNRNTNDKACKTTLSIYEKQLIEKKIIEEFSNNNIFEGSSIRTNKRLYTVFLIDEIYEEIFVSVSKEVK